MQKTTWWNADAYLSNEEILDKLTDVRQTPRFIGGTFTDREMYEIGLLQLQRHGVKLLLHPKGPYARHFIIEGSLGASREATSKLPASFQIWWRGLFVESIRVPKEGVAHYAALLIKRETALNENKKFVSELERLRDENQVLKDKVKDLSKGHRDG